MEKRNFTDVGYLSIDNGKIDITDPCYDRDQMEKQRHFRSKKMA